MIGGDVSDQLLASTVNEGPNDAHRAPALYKRSDRLERALGLIANEVCIQVYGQREAFHALGRLSRTHDQIGCAYIRKPQDCTSVNTSKRILYAGVYRHFRDDSIIGLF